MWARARPWIGSVAVGYAVFLAAAATIASAGLGVLVVPVPLRWIADHRVPDSESTSSLIGSAMLAVPLCLFHVGASVLGLVVAVQLNAPVASLASCLLGIALGPLALPWFGATGLIKLPLFDALRRSFDAWDRRGIWQWLSRGLLFGFLLSWPFALMALGSRDATPSHMWPGAGSLVAQIGLLLIPAALGIGARFAALETRAASRVDAVPGRANALVSTIALAASLLWLLAWCVGAGPRGGWPFVPFRIDWLVFAAGCSPCGRLSPR